MLPLFGIAGNMGSGKSTIAKVLVDNHAFLEVSQASPMKEIADIEFGFTVEALWGPTSERNKLRTGGKWEERGFFERNVMLEALQNAEIVTPADFADARVRSICQEGTNLIAKFYKENGGLTARYVLQILGTEVGRTIRDTIWTECAVNYSLQQLAINCKDVIPIDAVVISDVRFRSELLTIKRNGGTIIKVVDPKAPPPPEDEHISESELRGIPDFWFDAIWQNEKAGIEKLSESIQDVMAVDYFIKKKAQRANQ